MTLVRTVFRKIRRARRDADERLRRHIRTFERRRKAIRDFQLGDLAKAPEHQTHRAEIDRYWRHNYGRAIDPLWHLACAKVTGIRDVRFIPTDEFFEEILPFLNQMPLRDVYRDKNLSDIFLDCPEVPHNVIKRMHGRYYSGENGPLSSADAEKSLTTGPHDLMVKASQTDNGEGIRGLIVQDGALRLDGRACTLSDLERLYGADFLVQERVAQHPLLAEVHPASLNTLRIVTLRWKEELRVLLAFARFGTEGRLTDNAATGGLCCGIDTEGRLNEVSIDKAGQTFATHPTTGYAFAQRQAVPSFERACALALRLHAQIYHFDFVSWDIAIRADGEPLFIEVNFRGGVHFYQFACQRPLFGDLTEEILKAVRDSR